ncbi:MAG: polyprenyl diphosphate synthase [Geminicoccaceae bacterium]
MALSSTLETSAAVEQVPARPDHVAIIMDGNRRWARAQGRPPIYGHQQGANAVRRTVEACIDNDVSFLTLYAFSSENWKRPAHEVSELMNLLRFYLRREVANLKKNGVRLRFIGDQADLPIDIREMADAADGSTKGNNRLTLTIALNYGSRREISRAARRLAEAVRNGVLDPVEIDEACFAAALNQGIPDPDLLIRTSGEQRLSNFLLWELAYTELVFLPVSWPEFDGDHLMAAIEEYGRRERRYGASCG